MVIIWQQNIVSAKMLHWIVTLFWIMRYWLLLMSTSFLLRKHRPIKMAIGIRHLYGKYRMQTAPCVKLIWLVEPIRRIMMLAWNRQIKVSSVAPSGKIVIMMVCKMRTNCHLMNRYVLFSSEKFMKTANGYRMNPLKYQNWLKMARMNLRIWTYMFREIWAIRKKTAIKIVFMAINCG